ncbi:MAG: hypothetical protein AUH85_18430 [Chloroflexi bacterium 13_1_40CM_4_68_4]|nr:MAG: hypothetical protein AUH85_18430 [Chloroflexi bacterium 13_1_40CM_4_68_4]
MATLTATRVPTVAIPRATVRRDWVVILASLWMGAGLYWDGWAHGYGLPDSFWTIWHAAFYSGFVVTALAILTPTVLAHRRGVSWRAAIPAGYEAATLGVFIFAFAGIFDMTWHTVFGIELSTDALLSPSHMALGTGALLMVSGPFAAAARRPTRSGLLAQLPAVISLSFILGTFTFFTLFAGPYSGVIGSGPRPADSVLVRSLLGVYVFSALVVGCALVGIRERLLPPGALTVLIGFNGFGMILMRGHAPWEVQILFMVVAIVAGALGDLLLWRLGPSMDDVLRIRLFAFLLPALYWALYLEETALRIGSGWTVHELTGIVVQAGIDGLLDSYVFIGRNAKQTARP